MVFTNPALYFRTFATRQAITPDPSDLPAAQILEFVTTGENIVESITNVYQNNVSVDPSSNPDGTKKVNIQDNGRLQDQVVITGKILNTDTTFVNKLKTFSRRLQIEPTFHTFGIFGIAYPRATAFDLDPTDTFGYVIDKIQINVKGESQRVVGFQINLITGGTLA